MFGLNKDRKGLRGRDDDRDDSKQGKWDAYREECGKALKNRLNPPKKKNLQEKGRFQNYITTRRVKYDDIKKKYFPLEEKQSVEIKANMDFDTVFQKVWEYYKSEQGFLRANFEMTIITGVYGPRVHNTLELENKRDLFVLFENRTQNSKNSSIPPACSSLSSNYDPDNLCNHVEKSRMSATGVPPSLLPSLTRSAILQAAKVVTKECPVEVGRVHRLTRNNNEWVWMPSFDVKFVRREYLGSGSFRKTIRTDLIDRGALPAGNYVLKLWNATTVLTRKEDMATSTSETEVQNDLSKRVMSKSFSTAIKEKSTFGPMFEYIPSYLVILDNEIATMEPRLTGHFQKYINNNSDGLLVQDDIGFKAAALVHFSLVHTNSLTLLTDIQGVGHLLTDPEITSVDRYDIDDDLSLNFGIGNYGGEGIDNFKKTHKCTLYCRLAGLSAFA